MPDILNISIIRKDYRGRGIHRGKSITKMMEDVMQSEMRDFVSHLKTRHLSGPTSSDSISKRSGRLLRGTYQVVYRTEAGNVVGKVVIGEGAKYTPLHVGTGSSEIFTASGKGSFVIPMSWVRTERGKWRSPFVPGQLWSLYPRLFRPRRTTSALRYDALYWSDAKGEKPKLAFVLKKSIRIPQRVKIDEIAENRKKSIAISLANAFGEYDYAYLSKTVREGEVKINK
jgi:hypothetical protein